MKSFLKLKSISEILASYSSISPLQEEEVMLDDAYGRVISRSFKAPFNLPGFSRSTVDGYAVHARDVFGATQNSPALLQLAGKCEMGRKPDIALELGQAASIATGGMLPDGADCVVMLEYAKVLGSDLIELTRPEAPGANIIRATDDALINEELIPKGKKIRPQEIGCLASFGVIRVNVYKRAKVGIISTGSEIIPAGKPLETAQIYDVNSHSLAALVKDAHAIPDQLGIVDESKKSLENALKKAILENDVVVVSGGSSAGMADNTLKVFLSMPDAELICHGAAISPGKPFILVKAGKKWLLGLPGHVASALITARVFLLPLLQKLQGVNSEAVAPSIQAVLTRSITSALGRQDYIRCELHKEEKGKIEYHAVPIPKPSGVISGLVKADGLIVCPENRDGLAKDEKVEVILLN